MSSHRNNQRKIRKLTKLLREHPDAIVFSKFNEEKGGNFIFERKEFNFLKEDVVIDQYDGELNTYIQNVESALAQVLQSEACREATLRLQDSLYACMFEEGVSASMIEAATNGTARKRRRSSEQVVDPPFEAEDEATALENMRSILTQMKDLSCIGPFLEKVDVRKAPNYTELVSRPIDLSLISKKIDAGAYKLRPAEVKRTDGLVPPSFVADIEQLWTNCMAYNHPNSDIVIKAKWLQRRTAAIIHHVATGQPLKVSKADIDPPSAPKVTATAGESSKITAVSDTVSTLALGQRMKAILNDFCAIPEASPFLFPVNLAEVPGYKEMIKEPMDLSTVRSRLKSYDGNWKLFKHDMELIFKNCMLFNVEGSDIYNNAEKLLSTFRERVKAEARKIEPAVTPTTASGLGQASPSEMKQMKAILNDFCAIPEASPFLFPVNLAEVPGYKEMIKEPMDFSTVRSRLKSYDGNWKLFKHDMELIFKNCMLFNVEGSDIYNNAEKLLSTFRERYKHAVKQQETITLPATIQTVNTALEAKRFKILLNEISTMPDAFPFLYPVNLAETPGYKEMIKEPMDLSTVRSKLKSYDGNWKLFKHDMELIFKNCMLFNVEGSDIYNNAEKLLSIFRERVIDEEKRQEMQSAHQTGTIPIASSSDKTGMKQVLDAFCAIPEASPFLFPVNLAEVPGYKEMIKEPMDLSTVRSRLKSYDGNWKLFKHDMELIFKNCMLFNVEGSDIYNNAEKLLSTFRERYKSVCEQNFASEKKLSNKSANTKFSAQVSRQTDSKPLFVEVGVGDKVSKRRMDVLFHEICALPEAEPFLHGRAGDKGHNLSTIRDKMKSYDGNIQRFVNDVEELCCFGENSFARESAEVMLASQLREKIRGKLAVYFPPSSQDPVVESGQSVGSFVETVKVVTPVISELDLHNMSLIDLSKMMSSLVRDRDNNSDIVRRECYRKALLEHPSTSVTYPMSIYRSPYRVLNLGYASSNPRFHSMSMIYPVNFKTEVSVRLVVENPVTRRNREVDGEITESDAMDIVQEDNHASSEHRFVDVRLQNLILTQRDEMSYAILLGGTCTVVTEATASPKAAWDDVITLGAEIIQTLGARLRRCRAVLNALCLHEDIEPFLDLIDRSGPLGVAYYKTISAPMCFRMIYERLNIGYYSSEHEFAFDVRLVLDNCRLFNAPDSELYNAANDLSSTFECLFCEWVLNVVDKFVTQIPAGPWNDWQHLVCFDGAIEQIAVDDDKGEEEKLEEKSSEVDVMLTCGSCEDIYRSSKLPKRFRPVLKSDGSVADVDWYCPRCLKFQKTDFGDGFSRVTFTGCGNTYNLEVLSHHLRTYQCPAVHVGFVPFDVKSFLHVEDEAGDIDKKLSPAELKEKQIRDRVLSRGWRKGKVMRTDGSSEIVILSPSGRIVPKNQDDIAKELTTEVSFYTANLEARHLEWLAEIDAMRKKTKPPKDVKAVKDNAAPSRSSIRVPAGASGESSDETKSISVEIERSDPLLLKAGECAIYLNGMPNGITGVASWSIQFLSSAQSEEPKYLPLSELIMPKYGYFGLDNAAIRDYIEGLPGALGCAGYHFRAASETKQNILDRIQSVLSSQEALTSGESNILSFLKRDFIACVEIAKDRYTSTGKATGNIIRDNLIPFFQEHISEFINMSEEEVETVIGVWELLATAKNHVGKTHYGLVDIVKSLRQSHPMVPHMHQVVFDDVCTALTGLLLEDIRHIIGITSDNVWNSLLSVKPLNVITWPFVCNVCVIIHSIHSRHPEFPFLLFSALFASSGEFCYRESVNAEIVYISVFLLNHPLVHYYLHSGASAAAHAGRSSEPVESLEDILTRVLLPKVVGAASKLSGDTETTALEEAKPVAFESVEQFLNCVRYLWAHAMSHSAPESVIYAHAYELAVWFEGLLKDLGQTSLHVTELDTAKYAKKGEADIGVVFLTAKPSTPGGVVEETNIKSESNRESPSEVGLDKLSCAAAHESAEDIDTDGPRAVSRSDSGTLKSADQFVAEQSAPKPKDPWLKDLQMCLRLFRTTESDDFSTNDRLSIYSVLLSTCKSARLHDQIILDIVTNAPPPASGVYMAPAFRGGLPEPLATPAHSNDGDAGVSSIGKQVLQESLEAVGPDFDLSKATCFFSGIKSSTVGSSERWVYVPDWLLRDALSIVGHDDNEVESKTRNIGLEAVVLRVAFNRAHAQTVLKARLVQMLSVSSMNLVSSCCKADLSTSAFSAMAFTGVLTPAKHVAQEGDGEEEFAPKMFNEKFPTTFVGESASGSKFWVLGRCDFELLQCMSNRSLKSSTGNDDGSNELPWDNDTNRSLNAGVLVMTGKESGGSVLPESNTLRLNGRWSVTYGEDDTFEQLLQNLNSKGEEKANQALKYTLSSKLGEAHICFFDSPFRLLISQQGMLRKVRKVEKWAEGVHEALLAAATDASALEKKAIGPLTSVDTIRLIDVLWARNTETWTNFHFADLAEEVSVDIAPKDLGNVPRMVKDREYTRRRRVREGIVEELLDLHPKYGFMHQGDPFVRVKALLSSTNATRLLADPQIHELWQELALPHRAIYRRNLCDEPFNFIFQQPQDNNERAGKRRTLDPALRLQGVSRADEDGDDLDGLARDGISSVYDGNGDHVSPAKAETLSPGKSDHAAEDGADMDIEDDLQEEDDEEEDDTNGKQEERDEPTNRPTGRGRRKNMSHNLLTPYDNVKAMLDDRGAARGTELMGRYSKNELTAPAPTIRRKKIEQLDVMTGEVLRRYDSGTIAAAFMDISQSGISLCCAGKKPESNGFRWRFYEDPVPDIPYLSREELFRMKRPRRDMPNGGDQFQHVKKSYRTVGSREDETPFSALKRQRPREVNPRPLKIARSAEPAEIPTSARYHHDFATVGVNNRYVSKRVWINNEVLVSTVYVNHRLYKLKSELLNIVALLADFGLYWDALSMDHESSQGGRRAADMFVRFIQGASSPQELLHAITTLETVIPLAGMTRGEHRDAIEMMIYNAMADKKSAAKQKRHPFPTHAVTSSAVAARLYSLDRIIRYEKLPGSYTEYMSRSVAVCRSRCDQSARCPFSLHCSKAAGHFGRCYNGVEAPSRVPDIRPAFDDMIMGRLPYQRDSTTPYLNNTSRSGALSLPHTQFSSLPNGDFGAPMSYDPDQISKYQMSMERMNTKPSGNYSGMSSRYMDRYEVVTVKIIPFDINDVYPHPPPPPEDIITSVFI